MTDAPSITNTGAIPANEPLLARVARALAAARRESLFDDLAAATADLLDVEMAQFGRFVNADTVPTVRTLATFVDGVTLPPKTLALDDTPYATLLTGGFHYFPHDVATQFGHGLALPFPVAAFAGCALAAEDGETLGYIAVMSRGQLPDAETTASILGIFAASAVAELERAKTESALRASEERYRAIFNASLDGLSLLSSDGRIVDVNAAIENMYGYPRAEMVGRPALHFTHGPARGNAEKFLRTVRDKHYATMVDKAQHRDGREFYIEPRGVTVNYDGRPHILAIIRDVSERIEAETQRRTLESQLRQAQKMEALGHLTGGVAHDFNNILTSVLGYIELAAVHVADLGDEKLDRYLQRAERSAGRARDLIQQMLTFSRGRHGEPQALAIGPIIADSLALMRSMMPDDVTVNLRLDEELPPVMQDPLLLEQVLVNLCLNARDAMHGGGALNVAVTARSLRQAVCSSCRAPINGRFVDLSVSDTGHGMAQALIERIFEPFFSTKEPGKGSGMGLATVHGIAHEGGGHIVVESRQNTGTTMRVLLPVLERATEQRLNGPPARRATAPRSLQPASVLLIDGNENIAEFMHDLLSAWGLSVRVITNTDDALALISANPAAFDSVIIDETAAHGTGLEIAEAILGVRPDMPVIVYTSLIDLRDESRAREAGVHALLRKPLDVAALYDVLRECDSVPPPND